MMFPGGDPFSKCKPGGGSKIENKDYTKFVQWTPLKIAIAIICIALPYIGMVVAIASAVSIGAAMPLIVIPFFLMIVVALIYGIGLIGRVRHQPKYNRKQKRRSRR